jgi:hypothetical protein
VSRIRGFGRSSAALSVQPADLLGIERQLGHWTFVFLPREMAAGCLRGVPGLRPSALAQGWQADRDPVQSYFWFRPGRIRVPAILPVPGQPGVWLRTSSLVRNPVSRSGVPACAHRRLSAQPISHTQPMPVSSRPARTGRQQPQPGGVTGAGAQAAATSGPGPEPASAGTAKLEAPGARRSGAASTPLPGSRRVLKFSHASMATEG